MQEFKFLEYYTKYSSTGTIKHALRIEACFSHVFKSKKAVCDNRYVIIIMKGFDFCKNNHKNNGCVLSRKEIRNHIKLLNSIYPIEVKVLEKKDHFKVKLHINGSLMFHKYALTWVRYLYEYPYNMFVLDAYRLKKLPTFSFCSIATLFNIILSCYPLYAREIHQVPYNAIVKKLTVRELRDSLNSTSELNHIYKKVEGQLYRYDKEINGYSTSDFEFWDSEEIFEIRKEEYLKAFKIK